VLHWENQPKAIEHVKNMRGPRQTANSKIHVAARGHQPARSSESPPVGIAPLTIRHDRDGGHQSTDGTYLSDP